LESKGWEKKREREKKKEEKRKTRIGKGMVCRDIFFFIRPLSLN
jgi:hypothetical protein